MRVFWRIFVLFITNSKTVLRRGGKTKFMYFWAQETPPLLKQMD